MVVLLIIGILMAIAIPTYPGERSRAEDRAAQQDLRNALTAIMSGYYATDSFTLPSQYNTWQAWFNAEEPSLDFIGSGNVSATGQISTYIWNGSGPQSQIIKLADWSPDNMCWVILEIADTGYTYPWGGPNGGPVTVPGTYYGSYSSPADQCSQGLPAPSGGWQRNF